MKQHCYLKRPCHVARNYLKFILEDNEKASDKAPKSPQKLVRSSSRSPCSNSEGKAAQFVETNVKRAFSESE